MTNFNRQNLKTIRAEMQAALDAVAAKHGMSLSMGSIRFNDQTFRVTVEAAIQSNVTVTTGEDATDATQTVTVVNATVAQAMVMHKLKGAIGSKGERLIDYKASRPKFPFIYETVRGARYKCTPQQAQAIFGIAA